MPFICCAICESGLLNWRENCINETRPPQLIPPKPVIAIIVPTIAVTA